MKQKIIITALPAGRASFIAGRGTILRVSAAISLQVESTDKADTRLADVKDMLNWAALVKTGKFIVHYNGKPVEARVSSSAPDTQLWSNLFTPTVKVKAFVPEPLHAIPIVSYPVKHVLSYIKAVVEQTGKNFSNTLPDSNFYTENPILTQIADYAVPAAFPKRGREKLNPEDLVIKVDSFRRLQPGLLKNKFIPYNETPQPASDFAQLKNFHGLYNKPVDKYVAPEKPDFEFHDILSILSNYPQLQKKLGLIVELEFGVSDTALEGEIRIIPTGINYANPASIVCPATRFVRTDKGFFAKPDSGSIIDKGYLRINTEAFTVFQADTDGAALKLCQQMDALILKKARHIFYAADNFMPNAAAIPLFNNEAPRKEGLPSHRTAGIAVARNGMAEKLNKKFLRNNDLLGKLNTGTVAPAGVTGTNASWVLPAEVLTADDITLGYRMDIQPEDKGGLWFSLHKRQNNYSFINSSGNSISIPGMEADEGFIQVSASEEKTEGGGTQLKVSEAIARWEGWSLSVPRPGGTLNDPMLDNKNQVYKSDSLQEKNKYLTAPDADFKLNVKPELVKGSLPMLRFGKKYALKIRTVDLAGYSPDLQAVPENSGDCVKSGVKYFRYEPVDAPVLTWGTEVKDGESGEIMVIRSNEGMSTSQYESANAIAGKKMSDVSVRHVKPPRTTVEMAGTHGMFDNAVGKDKTAKQKLVYQDILKKDPLTPDNSGKMYVPVIESDSDFKKGVDYLVDPMAAGVSFFLSADDPNIKIANPSVVDRWVSFYTDNLTTATSLNGEPLSYDQWLAPKKFRIRLLEKDTPDLVWDKDSRTLEVYLQKGFMVKLYYACYWKPDDIVKYSGILDMMNMNSLSGELGQRIGKGQHWMFSPWRELTFVHAVQQPVTTLGDKKYPYIKEIKSGRNFGDNFATLNSKFMVHGPSTGQLDVEATWEEFVDDLAIQEISTEKDITVEGNAKVYHYTTLYNILDYVFGFPETKNPFPGIRHMFNDTKHRVVTYKTIATTRYRENFYHLIRERAEKGQPFPLTRESNTVTEIIKSSARPAAPDVAYIIPTFEWDRQTKGKTLISGRGSGLRIYLKRPWYSSGNGEKLAVVLGLPSMPSLAGVVGSAGVPVSTWGTDPTKLSGPIANNNVLIIQENFINPGPNSKVSNLSAAENPAAKVNIVAFDVSLAKFDKERQLYYVDLMLNPGLAYFPFIRLALARYQPQSVEQDGKDCCLSPVVLTDYIQIPAPRICSLEFNNGKAQFTVAVSGTVPKPSTGVSVFRTKFVIQVEPVDVPASESTHVNVNNAVIQKQELFLDENEVKNFGFLKSTRFILPDEYNSKPYKVRIMEYEMIELSRIHPVPAQGQTIMAQVKKIGERLVFAEVYEVNN